jgi:hypothetical protein
MSEKREDAKARLSALNFEARRLSAWLEATVHVSPESGPFDVRFQRNGEGGDWGAALLVGGRLLLTAEGAHPAEALTNLLAALKEAP